MFNKSVSQYPFGLEKSPPKRVRGIFEEYWDDAKKSLASAKKHRNMILRNRMKKLHDINQLKQVGNKSVLK
jgi:hypothetical protein